MRSILSVLALVLLFVAAPGRPTALAAGIDQSYTASPNLFADVDSSFSVKQTYTAGISGTLTQVTVSLTNVNLTGSTPDLQVQILTSKNAVLGSVTINPSGLPNWNNSPGSSGCAVVTVPISAPQTAGQKYAIALSSNSSLTYGWCGTAANGYAGGAVYQASPPRWKWSKTTSAGDLDFSTTVQ